MKKNSRILFNDNWSFLLMDRESHPDPAALPADGWSDMTLPHDWLIYDADNLYKDGLGIYKKLIEHEGNEGDDGRTFLIFDGVYMDSTYYLNGEKVGEWKYGYSQYVLELTDHLRPGANELTVFVDYHAPNSRWYSGAGIYRNVWLKTTPRVYVPENGVYVHAEPDEGGYALR